MSVSKEKITVLPSGGRKRGGGDSGGTGDPGGNDWRTHLVRNDKRKPTNCLHNVMQVLANDAFLDGLFMLDEFANAVVLTRDPTWRGGHRDEFTEIDATELAAWIGHPDRYELSTKRDTILECVEAIARRTAKHPVRAYLGGLVWDGVPRVETMFRDLFGGEDSAYTRMAAQCFMVSAVARVLWVDPQTRHNGAQVDFMLILEAEQGKGKTSAVRALFGANWYAEAMLSPAHVDFYQSLRGRWCVEIGEMDSFTKADVTKVKQAITSRFDTYRPSYGRRARSFRRECVFVGTTNENEYLRDSTGGRRFLPVRVSVVKVEEVVRLRDQLWAEAVKMFKDGFRWWELPAEAGEEQEKRFSADSWEEILDAWTAGRADPKHYPPRLVDPSPAHPPEWATTTELLQWALNIDVGKHGRPEQMRIAPIMKRLGFEHARQLVEYNNPTTGETIKTRERRWKRKGETGRSSDACPF